jgi:hypothetical protein
MARKEIIHKAGSIVDGMVSNYVPSEICDSYYQGFIEGATLAEEIMLKKVCEWLENHDMTEHISVIYSRVCSINFDKQGLIDALYKAMEK